METKLLMDLSIEWMGKEFNLINREEVENMLYSHLLLLKLARSLEYEKK